MNNYHVIGVMSGSSLDGLDIAFCHFKKKEKKWEFKILKAHTIPYSKKWKENLSTAHQRNAYDFIKLHKEYGKFIGLKINNFLNDCDETRHIKLVSSHGHTIFHKPDEHITFQIGDGATIAATTKITTISDFRSMDVALGGQGAPLVPVGDELLFNEYDYCLNFGGFANISFNKDNKRIGYDLCPVNIIINHLTNIINKDYDKNGEMARQGIVNKKLLGELNNIEYYSYQPPKSLGKEWLETGFLPIINKYDIKLVDKLRTIYEHIAIQITQASKKKEQKSILLTGGGTHNKFLVELIKKQTHHRIIIPDKIIIDFKEAIIFAFLGVLRLRNEINCLSSATGAKYDNFGGVIYSIKN